MIFFFDKLLKLAIYGTKKFGNKSMFFAIRKLHLTEKGYNEELVFD